MVFTDPADVDRTHRLFEVVARDTTLAARVSQQIEELIVQGRLQPGDLLPPERELARQFGVSRTVIREAVSGLMAKGLLDVRTGSGTVVSSPSMRSVAQSITLLLRASLPARDYEKVREVRRPLELAIARLAAERRTEQDLGRMQQILAAVDTKRGDRDSFAQWDVEFHRALAYATQNELFVVMLDTIGDIMFEVRQMGYEVPGNPDRAIRHHLNIFEQVRAGDVAAADQAMTAHMDEAEATLRQALALLQEHAPAGEIISEPR